MWPMPAVHREGQGASAGLNAEVDRLCGEYPQRCVRGALSTRRSAQPSPSCTSMNKTYARAMCLRLPAVQGKENLTGLSNPFAQLDKRRAKGYAEPMGERGTAAWESGRAGASGGRRGRAAAAGSAATLRRVAAGAQGFAPAGADCSSARRDGSLRSARSDIARAPDRWAACGSSSRPRERGLGPTGQNFWGKVLGVY